MLKHAFKSYVMSFHPKRRKQVKEQPKRFLASFVTIWVFMAVFNGADFPVFLTRMVPVLLLKWSNLVIGAFMGKLMLLCPMKKESRKEYINYMIAFKIGCPILLGFFIEMFWNIMYEFNLKQTLFLIIAYLSFGIADTIHIDGIDKTDNRILSVRKDKTGNVKWAVQNFWVMFISLLLLFGNYGESELANELGKFYYILNYAGVVILIVLDIVIFLTQYKNMIEETVDYELAFHVPGRLHYIENE